MDVVHHTLIGGAGFAVAAAHSQEIAGIAFIAGSVFPDLDVFFMLFGKRAYLKNHQGVTHSLLLSPLFALLVALPLFFLFDPSPAYAIAAMLGIWLHVALDLMNTFRIAILFPIKKRSSLDAVFFVDATALLITAAFYLAWYLQMAPQAAYVYGMVFFMYVFAKFFLHRQVIDRTGATLAIPSSLNPFGYFLLTERADSICTEYYNFLTGRSTDVRQWNPPPDRIDDLASTSRVFNDMKAITRVFRVTDYFEDATGTTIHAADLGIRNYGGKFGRTVLRFDRDGMLLDEVANI